MSDYSLVQRGVISATSADGAGPKDASIVAVKPASSFLVARVRDRRRNASVQRGTVALTSADTSPKIVVLGAAVDMSASVLEINLQEERATDLSRGVQAVLSSGSGITLTFPALDVGDTINLAYQVVEHKPRREATVHLVDEDTVRLTWDGTLAVGETIDATFDVFDLENFGDDQKEVLYRLQRLLGYAGENLIQDNIIYDDAGNMTSYRLRVFSSKVNAEAATLDLPDGDALETGELVRVTTTQDIELAKNDRLSLYRLLTDLLANEEIN